MTNKQKKQYKAYIDKRCLGMPVSQYKVLIKLYNQVFNKNIDYQTFMQEKGLIHKIGKIEAKMDNHFYNLTK